MVVLVQVSVDLSVPALIRFDVRLKCCRAVGPTKVRQLRGGQASISSYRPLPSEQGRGGESGPYRHPVGRIGGRFCDTWATKL